MLPACSEGEPPIRWQPTAGRRLVYRGVETDTRPTRLPTFGIGGTFSAEVTFTMTCASVDPDGSAVWEVETDSIQARGPDWMETVVDSETPEDDPGDAQQADAFVRKWMGRSGVMTMNPLGLPRSGLPQDPEFDADLSLWARRNPPVRLEVGQRIGLWVRPVHNVVRWLQTPGWVLPDDPYPVADATWRAVLPPVNSGPFAGKLGCVAGAKMTQTGDVVRIEARGDFVQDEAPPAPLVRFGEGTVEVDLEMDRATGVLLNSREHVKLTFHKLGSEAEPVTWDIERKGGLVEGP
jgi:hypothetical protein